MAHAVPSRVCAICGKVNHPTWAAARWAARREALGARLRVYCCPASGSWHLPVPDQLRTGLANRTLAEQDAFRLLFITRHALLDADMVLRRQHDLPLPQSVLAQIADLRQLSVDLLGQLDSIQEEVMRLFGHSGDSAPVLVPQH